ncbi:MAG: winged helix-turn-helix transcriptional regulator [Planctomycetaceae bacterium]|nr:winged helix-turn-helix transcriptional regulator [Planctomycetaceae bacterium]MCB9937444.1 winged helix-turn-helix transcriptional regulator [Planctomycetaceae bacterium]
MTDDIIPSDIAILDLLRKTESLSISDLASVTEVTATAVRQRLTRLMAQGYIDRDTTRAGRGRPSHQYRLTAKGRRKTGSNFADLAIALWQEIRSIEDVEVRRGLLQRLAKRLADVYADQIEGESLEDKMESLATLFGERKVPFTVTREVDKLPILTALACPYPDLAEQDRTICSMEKILFSQLLGEQVSLSQCRLDGESCCTFEVRPEGTS